jgi:hypothetical protein
MGYTTDFTGEITIVPPLNAAEINYLKLFSTTRHMQRERGPYFVDGLYGGDWDGSAGSGNADVTDYNSPDATQPGLWCQWEPTEAGDALVWDGGEKFYNSVEWMRYLIDYFLRPNAACKGMEQFSDFTFDHVLNGEIYAQGEDPSDKWSLLVTDNIVEEYQLTHEIKKLIE